MQPGQFSGGYVEKRNQVGYEDRQLAAYYARKSDLQPPEEAILRELASSLPGMRMLDVGVGGGRTTLHFAKWAREYVGIDYSPAMIAECRRRFDKYPKTVSFQEGDASNLESFEDGSFDFVLFSFNGLDYGSPQERERALREIQRVCRPGGLFCFSTHNLQASRRIFGIRNQLCLHPVRLVRRLREYFTLSFVLNRPSEIRRLEGMDEAMLNDGAHEGRFRTFYTRPLAQLRRLSDGFESTRVFALADGKEIVGDQSLLATEDPWLYYLCSRKGTV